MVWSAVKLYGLEDKAIFNHALVVFSIDIGSAPSHGEQEIDNSRT